MVVVKKLLENGAWKGWLLGIVGTLIATAITNGILFQRQVKEQIAINEQRLKYLETRARETIIREFARQDQRMDNIVAAIANLANTVPTNTDVGQQLHQRDIEIQHLQQRIEKLERK
jgi:hypothetical protein